MSAALAVIVFAAIGQVVLRGTGDELRVEVESVSLEGVRVGGDEGRVIGLDSVKLVSGAYEAEWALVRDTAEDAWRARVRLARGDTSLASHLFEELYEKYRGIEGPTALLVCEGTVRCRLANGDRDGAVEAWLCALSLRRRGYKLAGDPPLDPVIDEATGLVPELAPVWGKNESFSTVESMRLPDFADQFVNTLAGLYARSATGVASQHPVAETSGREGDRDTTGFVALLIDAVAPDAELRASARGRLESGLDNQVGTWREAWVRVAIGRSYMMESKSAAQTNGVLHLLHVPARFGDTQAYLAGVAVSEVGIGFTVWGDGAAAGILLEEMRAGYAGHVSLGALEDAVARMGDTDDETDNERGAG